MFSVGLEPRQVMLLKAKGSSMAKKRIVIDASIARSASESNHLVSSRARHFLNAVLENCLFRQKGT